MITATPRAYGLRVRYLSGNFIDVIVTGHTVGYDDAGLEITSITMDRVDGLPEPSFSYPKVVAVEPIAEQASSASASGVVQCRGTTTRRHGGKRCGRRTSNSTGFCDDHETQGSGQPRTKDKPWQSWVRVSLRTNAGIDAKNGGPDPDQPWERDLLEWWNEQDDGLFSSVTAEELMLYAQQVVKAAGGYESLVAAEGRGPGG